MCRSPSAFRCRRARSTIPITCACSLVAARDPQPDHRCQHVGAARSELQVDLGVLLHHVILPRLHPRVGSGVHRAPLTGPKISMVNNQRPGGGIDVTTGPLKFTVKKGHGSASSTRSMSMPTVRALRRRSDGGGAGGRAWMFLDLVNDPVPTRRRRSCGGRRWRGDRGRCTDHPRGWGVSVQQAGPRGGAVRDAHPCVCGADATSRWITRSCSPAIPTSTRSRRGEHEHIATQTEKIIDGDRQRSGLDAAERSLERGGPGGGAEGGARCEAARDERDGRGPLVGRQGRRADRRGGGEEQRAAADGAEAESHSAGARVVGDRAAGAGIRGGADGGWASGGEWRARAGMDGDWRRRARDRDCDAALPGGIPEGDPLRSGPRDGVLLVAGGRAHEFRALLERTGSRGGDRRDREQRAGAGEDIGSNLRLPRGGDGAGAASAARAPLNAFRHPPVVHADPAWYGQSGVFGKFAARSERYPEFQRALDYKFEWMLFNQRWAPWFGMWDYGDWKLYFDGKSWIQWGNNEPAGDFTNWMQFMRTGDPRVYDAARANSRHSMDVDNVHWPADPVWLGDSNVALDYLGFPEGAEGHDEAGDWLASRQSALGTHADRARVGAGLDGRLSARRGSSRARRRAADRGHAPEASVGRARIDGPPPLSRALERDRGVGRDQGRTLLEGNRRSRRAYFASGGERSGRQPRARSLWLRRCVCVALAGEVLPDDGRPPRRRGAGASRAPGARRAAAQSRDGVVSVERVFARARLRIDRRAEPARRDPSSNGSIEDRQAREAFDAAGRRPHSAKRWNRPAICRSSRRRASDRSRSGASPTASASSAGPTPTRFPTRSTCWIGSIRRTATRNAAIRTDEDRREALAAGHGRVL